jgi:ParB/RepB/Spo0J family partition protein
VARKNKAAQQQSSTEGGAAVLDRPSAIDEAYAAEFKEAKEAAEKGRRGGRRGKPVVDAVRIQSPLQRFLANACEFGPDFVVRANTLFGAFWDWCDEMSARDGKCTLAEFGAGLVKDAPQVRSSGEGEWLGVRLTTAAAERDAALVPGPDGAPVREQAPATSEPELVKVLGAVHVMLEDIAEEVGNHRQADPDDEAKIRAIAESMKQVGQLQPVRLMLAPGNEAGPYTLVFGSRRLRACRLIGAPSIRAEICPALSPEQAAAARAIENLQREDLTDIEASLAVGELVTAIKDAAPGGGLSDQEAYDVAAARLGKSPTWVRDRAYLQRLSPLGQEMTRRRRLPLEHAREIAKLADHDQQNRIIAGCTGADEDWKPGKSIKDEDLHERPWRLAEVQRMVGPLLRSLKVVPWRLDKPFAGAPACDRCPNNSANDRMLFEHDADEATEQAERPPTCTDGGCFARKLKATEKALAAGLKDARAMARDVKKAGDELAITERGLAPVTPDIVRPGTFARKAKLELEPGSASKPAGAADGGRSSSKPKPPTAAELAERELATAMFNWSRKHLERIRKAAAETPALGLCLHVFSQLKEVGLATAYYTRDKTREKALLSPSLAHALKMLQRGTGEAAAEIWTAGKLDPEDYTLDDCGDKSPDLLHRIAEACGVQIDARPKLEDFLAADESAETPVKAEAAEKKKAKAGATAKRAGGAAKARKKAKAAKVGGKKKAKKGKR